MRRRHTTSGARHRGISLMTAGVSRHLLAHAHTLLYGEISFFLTVLYTSIYAGNELGTMNDYSV